MKLWLIAFFSFENKSWGLKSSAAGGQKKSAAWGQNRVHQGSKLSASTQTLTLCGCTQFWSQIALCFDPQQHFILTPSSTWFWPPGLIFKTQKAINHNFKRHLDFLKKAIHLKIFLRFYRKKYFFYLGISSTLRLELRIKSKNPIPK